MNNKKAVRSHGIHHIYSNFGNFLRFQMIVGLRFSEPPCRSIFPVFAEIDFAQPEGQVENSEISEMSEISENYLRVFHLRVIVLALYVSVENSEMFGNLFETSLNFCLKLLKLYFTNSM